MHGYALDTTDLPLTGDPGATPYRLSVPTDGNGL